MNGRPSFVHSFVRRAAVALTIIAAVALLAPAAGAVPPPSGVAVHPFVTGMPFVMQIGSPFDGVGPVGLTFDTADRLLVADAVNLGFYRFGFAGSTAPVPSTTGTVQTAIT